MSKELTPLEALEELKEANTIYCGCASNLFARYRFEIETIEKALKALEIIKKYIRVGKPFGTACYIYLNDESEMISDKDFDLLKEVLK